MELAAYAVALGGTLLATQVAGQEKWERLGDIGPMPEATETGMLSMDGWQMYWASYGQGDPVLLIHGGLAHADVWGPIVDDLDDDHRIIVADSRGHGRSSWDGGPMHYRDMVTDYVALIDALDLGPVALVGWSDGGIIGLEMALSHPDRLTGVYALGANATVDGVNHDGMTSPIFGEAFAWGAAEYTRLSPHPEQFEAFTGAMAKMWGSEPALNDRDLASISLPVTIAAGDEEEAVWEAHSIHMAEAIPGAKLDLIAETSHFAPLQDPGAVTSSIRRFLMRVQ